MINVRVTYNSKVDGKMLVENAWWSTHLGEGEEFTMENICKHLCEDIKKHWEFDGRCYTRGYNKANMPRQEWNIEYYDENNGIVSWEDIRLL